MERETEGSKAFWNRGGHNNKVLQLQEEQKKVYRKLKYCLVCKYTKGGSVYLKREYGFFGYFCGCGI